MAIKRLFDNGQEERLKFISKRKFYAHPKIGKVNKPTSFKKYVKDMCGKIKSSCLNV